MKTYLTIDDALALEKVQGEKIIELLKILNSSIGIVMPKELLMARIFGLKYHEGEASLNSLVQRTRRFLDNYFRNRYEITAIDGYGYGLKPLSEKEWQYIYTYSEPDKQCELIIMKCNFTHSELYIFRSLYQKRERVIPTESLIEINSITLSTLKTHISSIRDKLEVNFPHLQLLNIYEAGYVITDTNTVHEPQMLGETSLEDLRIQSEQIRTVLELLLEKKNKLVTKKQLINLLWNEPDEERVYENLKILIHNTKKLFKERGWDIYFSIETIRGAGYILVDNRESLES